MLNYIKENKHKYYDAIIKNLDEYSYRNKRYHIEFSIAVTLCDVEVDFKDFIDNKRKTDTLIPLEKNLCCLILDCAPSKSALKAAENMQAEFRKKYFDKKLYTAVVSSKNYDSDKMMLESLFDILEYSIEHNIENPLDDIHHMSHSA